MFTLLLGCVADEDPTVTADLDENIGTIVHATWNTTQEAVSWVEFGPTPAYGFKTPLGDSATHHEAALLGIPGGATWHYRVAWERVDGQVSTGTDHEVTVGGPDDDIPELSTENASSTGVWGNYTAFSWWSVVAEDSFLAILDDAGAVVWWWVPDWGYAVSFHFDATQTEVIVLLAGLSADPEAQIARVPLDGSAPTIFPAPGAHHDLDLLDDGTIAYVSGEVRTIDGQEVLGDRVVEIDEDGATREVWNAFDDEWPIDEHAGWEISPADWTHVNGITHVPESDAWVVTMYWTDKAVALDRDTGEVLWEFGGDDSDFYITEEDGFSPGHSPVWIDGELGIFDNGAHRAASRLSRYTLNSEDATAGLTWSWDAPLDEHTNLMGNWHPLPDGGLISGFGELELVRLIDAEGAVVQTTALDAFGLVGEVGRIESLYPSDATFAE